MRVCDLMNWKSTIIGLMAFILLTVTGISMADDYNTTNFRNQKVTTDQYIEALKPKNATTNNGLKFRSLGIGGSKQAVSLELKFEFDSYQLSGAAKQILNNLGNALQNRQLSQYKFMIEGHTDAAGAHDYNKMLSEKRAENVKRYFVDHFGIDPNRIRAVGRGELDLLDKNNPDSAANRRVQVVNLQ